MVSNANVPSANANPRHKSLAKNLAWFNSSLRRHMRNLRGKAGLSRQDVANESGYPRALIASWESGYRAPSFTQLSDWAQSLGYYISARAEHAKRMKKADALWIDT